MAFSWSKNVRFPNNVLVQKHIWAQPLKRGYILAQVRMAWILCVSTVAVWIYNRIFACFPASKLYNSWVKVISLQVYIYIQPNHWRSCLNSPGAEMLSCCLKGPCQMTRCFTVLNSGLDEWIYNQRRYIVYMLYCIMHHTRMKVNGIIVIQNVVSVRKSWN